MRGRFRAWSLLKGPQLPCCGLDPVPHHHPLYHGPSLAGKEGHKDEEPSDVSTEEAWALADTPRMGQCGAMVVYVF